jgi:ABC-type antimicrobial peptide transport system permease subunit
MSDTTNNSGGGIGFAGALTIAFIVLKLTGVINWSWLWVLAPLWISWAIVLAILAVVGVVMLIAWRSDERSRKRLNNYYRTSQGRTVRRKTRRY